MSYENLMGDPTPINRLPATLDYDGHTLPAVPTNNAQALRSRLKKTIQPSAPNYDQG